MNNTCLQNVNQVRPPYQRALGLPSTRAEERVRQAELSGLAGELITELIAASPHIYEGIVMSLGPMPYRRLDCDRRALAYVRARPRKGMVRIDISGLWLIPRESPLRMHGSGACATLIVRSAQDKTEAIAFLVETIDATRRQHARIQERAELRRARGRTGGASLAADAPTFAAK